MKPIKAEISEAKKKICSPVAVENLLDDSLICCFFNHPEIAQGLCLPFSEAVVDPFLKNESHND